MSEPDPQPAPPIPEGPDGLIGQVVAGRFEVRSRIARGSMGAVYLAEQRPLGRPVALKVLALTGANVSGRDDATQRFLREASTLAKLHHPNTVRVYDFGVWDGHSWLAMEYVDGTTLEAVLKGGALEPRRALHLARQICASLLEAHARGLVHRDLKPRNVLVTRLADADDVVKVVDFGLVKELDDGIEATSQGLMLGTPLFMAPEQIRGLDVDGRADLYALGVILYRMLTGSYPFRADKTTALLMAHLSDAPPPFAESASAHLPPCVEWTVMRCLEKDPRQRFASVAELNRALKACDRVLAELAPTDAALGLVDGRLVVPAYLEESGSSWSTVMRAHVEPRPTPRRAPWVAAVVGGLALAILGALAFGLADLAEGIARGPAVVAPTTTPSVPRASSSVATPPAPTEPTHSEPMPTGSADPSPAPTEPTPTTSPPRAPTSKPSPRPAPSKPAPTPPPPAPTAAPASPTPEPPPAPTAPTPSPSPSGTDLRNPWD